MRPKKQKNVVMSKTAVRKLEEDVMKKMLILSAAYLMDEFGYSEDAICEYWDGLTRYCDAIDEKFITLNSVRQIIYEHTGLDIRIAGQK